MGSWINPSREQRQFHVRRGAIKANLSSRRVSIVTDASRMSGQNPDSRPQPSPRPPAGAGGLRARYVSHLTPHGRRATGWRRSNGRWRRPAAGTNAQARRKQRAGLRSLLFGRSDDVPAEADEVPTVDASTPTRSGLRIVPDPALPARPSACATPTGSPATSGPAELRVPRPRPSARSGGGAQRAAEDFTRPDDGYARPDDGCRARTRATRPDDVAVEVIRRPRRLRGP